MGKWVEQLNSRQILGILYGVCVMSLVLTATGAWFVRDNTVSPGELLTLRWIWMAGLVMFISAILLIGRPLINRMASQNERMRAKHEELEHVLQASKQNETKLQYRNELIEVLASKESLFDYSSVIEKIVLLTSAEFGALLLVKDGEISSVVPKEMTEEQQESLKTKSLLLKRVMISKLPAATSKKVADDLHEYPYYIYETVIPVMDPSDDKMIGCLYLARYDEQFDASEKSELNAFANQLAISLLRMRLYRQMQQDRKETAQLINSVREAILYLNYEEESVVGNRAFIRMFDDLQFDYQGYEELADVKIDIEQLAERVDQRDHFISYVEHVFDRKPPEEGLSISLDQGDCFLQVYAESIYRDGKLHGTMLVLRDVTAETEIDRMKSELVSTVSHELRTPLSSIYGFTELMLERDLKESRRELYLKTIHDEAKRLSFLVSDFLDLQKMEAGKQTFEWERVDLYELARDSIGFYQETTDAHHIHLDADSTQDFTIEADLEGMRQLLGNLLSNAVKYSPDGGNVLVSLERLEGQVVMKVRDNGIGIPSSALPNLFGKFYRVDNSDRRKIGGTGLGLAICKEIAKAHDGHLHVESVYGEGSTFICELPTSKEVVHQ
ncbi:ATP-binding protein [Exiguobacterium alkaliphilum]|uniref:histidine kinase n=1 Tax=Exiguobacterium alkaliphilum TaxID=1428684 RepID=A0ABT2L1C2_9BACL|nr:ATP-binding protein [Exiguobacterium alkaliphilum]MCT4796513.1 ATP-binding protein [Exiguobacterium alkaliphilum]